MRPPEILFHCPRCGAPGRFRPPLPEGPGRSCTSCSLVLPLEAPDQVGPGRAPGRCPLCGDDKLYVQKDFSRTAGCAVVALGAALVPWTYGLSLAVCALLDWILYHRLPPLTVCYVCSARIRGLPVNPDHAPFDLTAAQTWEARSLNWRRRHAPPD